MKKSSSTSGTIWRWTLYLIGMLTLAFGIILNTKANLGVSPIISVAYSVSEINHLNFGNTTLALYILFVILEFPLKGKNYQWIDLLQIVVSIIFTRFVNLFNALPINPTALWSQLLVLFFGITLTGIGAALTVDMELIPNPGDGIVAAVAGRIKKPLGFSKNLFDSLMITTTFFIGLATGNLWVGIGVGTVLAVIGVGRVVALFNHLFLDKARKLAGLESSVEELAEEDIAEESSEVELKTELEIELEVE